MQTLRLFIQNRRMEECINRIPRCFSQAIRILIIAAFMAVSAFSQPQSLQDRLIEAQIENQRAQAEYNRAQTKPKTLEQMIVSAIPSAVGTIIGAFVALSGVLLTSLRQSRVEDKKWERAKQDELVKETRLAVAELTKKLSIAIQAIQWLTWKARYDPDNATEDDLTEYDHKMKGLWPEIVSSRTYVAALNKDVHTQMTPLILDVAGLDVKIILASTLFRRDRQEGIKELAKWGEACDEFDSEFVNKVADILNLDNIQPQYSRKAAPNNSFNRSAD